MLTFPTLDARFCSAMASDVARLVIALPLRAATTCTEVPLMVTLPALLARFCWASASRPSALLLAVELDNTATCTDVPEIVMGPGATGEAAMVAVATNDKANSASDFMMIPQKVS